VVDPVLIAGYLALFVAVGAVFLAVNLIVGWLVRPRMPNTEKLEVYECGEPAIGSSFVQFDLRFYVVALLFIIFDVEVAVFFPWATVFGKATQLSDP
jgi:NADH-quinone oxidoreductase subunit A